MPAKIAPGRNALKCISGRNAAFDRRRDQLRHEVMLALTRQEQSEELWRAGLTQSDDSGILL